MTEILLSPSTIYYRNNIDKMRKYYSTQRNCELCGGTYRPHTKKRHESTKKHQLCIKSKNEEVNIKRIKDLEKQIRELSKIK